MKNQKLIVVICIVLTVLLFTACSGNGYKDGTYEGTSDQGMHPGLKVSVTVEDGKMTQINVIEYNETEGIGTQAIEQLPEKIIEAQSTDVDSISGASVSSDAIKDAVNKALEQAKN